MRAGQLTFTQDLDFQFQARYGHDPQTQKRKFKVSRFKREWKHTDGLTDAAD